MRMRIYDFESFFWNFICGSLTADKQKKLKPRAVSLVLILFIKSKVGPGGSRHSAMAYW
jgi:hypothetical protein